MSHRASINPAAAAHALRLVGGDETARHQAPIAQGDRAARRAVAFENITASTLAPTDVRSIFATTVASSLEGGRAAILTPVRRRELVAAAVDMGLRPFDANLAIAVVQDAARSGERLSSPSVIGGLRLLRAPEPPSRAAGRLLGLAIAIAAAVVAILVAWFSH